MKIKKFGRSEAAALLPKRKKYDNKTAGGKTLIIAGHKNMFGAGILAATAAARSGSGFVYLMTDKEAFPAVKHPDFILLPRRQKIPDAMSIAIGPGMGITAESLKILKSLIRAHYPNVIVDADALTLAAENNLIFPAGWVATPHEGELAKILKIQAREVRIDRKSAVLNACKKLGCTVLLKGHNTLVATADRLVEIKSGGPALAKAGTGDVLTGMIAGFIACGLSGPEAACTAAYLHGHIGERWVKNKKDVLSLMASDLLNEIPHALFKLRKSQ